MKNHLLTIIMALVSLGTICGTSAEPGPPPMQEVDATGQGANADDAFKQAVNDAVRQVVGTLVSAENVIKNDRLIKDEVLTLSNGFVEKVLNQDKIKQDDGSWQVKLKCIVRKGQLYGRLQEVKVPTIKFEGVSLFADVVSQQAVEKDTAALLVKAILGWNGSCYEAVSLSAKPEIIEKNEEAVKIRMSCRVTLNRIVYEKQFMGKLTNILETLSVEKEVDKSNESGKAAKQNSERMMHDQKVMYVDGVPVGYVINKSVIEPILKESGMDTEWGVFGEKSRAALDLFAVFRDSDDKCLLIRQRERPMDGWLDTGTQATEFGTTCRIFPKLRQQSGDQEYSDTRDFKFEAEIPLQYLSKITKIELHVATTLEPYLTKNKLPVEAPGGFLYRSKETGWVWKFAKSSGDRSKLPSHPSEFFYVPTFQISEGQSQEFTTKAK